MNSHGKKINPEISNLKTSKSMTEPCPSQRSKLGLVKASSSPRSSQPSSFSASDVSADEIPLSKRTCSGACCTDFHIGNYTWERIKELRIIRIFGGFDRKRWKTIDPDLGFIADMLIPLRRTKDGSEYYSCRHFDRTKKLCTVYDKRPQMCRRFGVQVSCGFKTCGWDGALRKKDEDKGKSKADATADPISV